MLLLICVGLPVLIWLLPDFSCFGRNIFFRAWLYLKIFSWISIQRTEKYRPEPRSEDSKQGAESRQHRFARSTRVHSAYVPVVENTLLSRLDTNRPLLAEHGLYQADWLCAFTASGPRNSGMKPSHFILLLDPKCHWAHAIWSGLGSQAEPEASCGCHQRPLHRHRPAARRPADGGYLCDSLQFQFIRMFFQFIFFGSTIHGLF